MRGKSDNGILGNTIIIKPNTMFKIIVNNVSLFLTIFLFNRKFSNLDKPNSINIYTSKFITLVYILILPTITMVPSTIIPIPVIKLFIKLICFFFIFTGLFF